ncbi:MAG: bifunctional 4-hydroxy-2-oxoglutarate aldolase/2-dehydro-3-deoxy-phosphogluconate aldolase [Devosia sp.]|uniref:bifunctional 4-hydroxy-2-oxoglutarate aldolase/2-dehydro-3-deoxy-phosphogluconate aldolase n=1 Tax=unclassified Devosia TaxID=196773 RepID=UPI0019F752FB|nr:MULTISPECIES: bifunctional 4-hydroxy-2-oxoglutarate aldolase/2-dehydro-3-deoxy-phosphogluconate aldolase [unclassified Devosia]MBF0680357.1 bifunctional 4-hydroxy-2-oxoglutarate aldolase/2-dehydro-3-deoxy-phosphogluconate aldolase [Devosia sp.]WEJ32941.1 bifunctional 4-hydroxy-2-oxoglutarate aldolase/2-dehydro-3-deoxy-phosphogluconate aldolase [Devosia sp. SD17-2]
MPQDANAIRSILTLAPVVPVIILDDVSKARPLAEALVAGGLPILEVTLRTPNALKVMEEMAKVTGAIVGSGTVRNEVHMRASVDVGCRFMVSPGASPRLLDAADDVSIPLLPGIGTPTEAMAAAERGYSFLKFFPAEALGGAPVLKAFASPLPDITFCPTGGIDVIKAKTYLALPNVICVGGSWIMPNDAIESGDFARIEALAREASALRG